ncbi:pyridoxamine 5'-phosphate oxidase family protein [Streptomyces sp. NK15101]|uniref:pyridoxamine 5'-phosphate oxidase family protein n=1 Tax=Streptomyces sp. NK15101 TaxID=2873261 RepID=UPI001CED3B1E|nr:pyridoxamine 5'-phosphate oxidase family protein [Streptomyces sp. NK15101]
MATGRLVEMPGAEALWLLEGGKHGRLVLIRRGEPFVRPAVHIWTHGHLVVRTPVQATAVPSTVTYQVDRFPAPSASGWSISVTGPATEITEPHEAAHYRRALDGWVHGPHDTLLRITPQTLTGFRLAPGDAGP